MRYRVRFGETTIDIDAANYNAAYRAAETLIRLALPTTSKNKTPFTIKFLERSVCQ
jgi:hypothetical protein